MELPGRNRRREELPLPSTAVVAEALLPLLAPLLAAGGPPWAVVGHSMGTWLAHDFVRAALTAGLPAPRHMYLACFPPPSLSMEARPWAGTEGQTEAAFKARNTAGRPAVPPCATVSSCRHTAASTALQYSLGLRLPLLL